MGALDSRRDELQQAITDLESQLAELRQQLLEVEHQAQHEAIKHLDAHLQEVDNKYSDIKSVWAAVVEEVREMFHADSG